MEEIRKQMAQVIYRVLSGDISADEAIRKYNAEFRPKNDESIHRAAHALYHYRDDADIRKKDEEYSERQTTALKRIADKLADGLPLSDKEGYW